MPTNLLKIYNELLDTLYVSHNENMKSFHRVFERDFIDNGEITFQNKKIYPLPTNDKENLDRLFEHLTERKEDKETNVRSFHHARSIRIHWIKYHLQGGD